MHSRITFYVYAKIGQVNGRGGATAPLESATGWIGVKEDVCTAGEPGSPGRMAVKPASVYLHKPTCRLF